MRGKLSEQDLTDYALNELDPHDRLYVESMLAVSKECRNDVYQMIEMAQTLEEAFEMEAGGQAVGLTEQQRAALVRPQFQWRHVIYDAVAGLAAAACVAFAITQPTLWDLRDPNSKAAKVSTKVAQFAETAPEKVSQIVPAVASALDNASDAWISDSPTTCTPPSLIEGVSGMPSLGNMPTIGEM
jgi:anti-sigma factor RsiW